MRRVPIQLSLLTLFSLTLILSAHLPAAAKPVQQVIILIGGVSAQDLVDRDLPYLKEQILPKAAIALVNVRTGAGYSPENCYASFSSSARTQAPPESRTFQLITETTGLGPGGLLYRRYFLQTPPPTTKDDLFQPAFTPYIGAITKMMLRGRISLQPGLLAQRLATADKEVILIGAGDSSSELNRSAALWAMDPKGNLTAANFSTVLIEDPSYPGGMRTDYSTLLTLVQQALRHYSIVIVETGDLLRLYAESDLLSPRVYQRWKTHFLSELGQFLAALDRETPENTHFWLLSAYPALEAYRSGQPLTLLLNWSDPPQPGLLTSPTTRRPGLVTNLDLIPSLLQPLDLTAQEAYGAPVASIPWTGDRLTFLAAQSQRWAQVNANRAPFLKSYVLSHIILVGVGVLLLWPKLKPPTGSRRLRLFTTFCLAETLPPLLLLFVAALAPSRLLYLTVFLLLPLLCGLLLTRFKTTCLPFSLVFLGTALLLLIDTLCGWGLGANSLLGYDPIGGARFYGIGNEYMGVLIGAWFMGWAAFLETSGKKKFWEKIIPLATLAALIILGSPQLGANVGGTIGLAAASATWVFLSSKQKITVRQVLNTGLVLLLLFFLFIWWDLRWTRMPSHLGRFVLQVSVQGLPGLWQVFSRKLAMNWKLLRYTIWTNGLLSFIIGLALIFWRPQGLAKRIQEKYPRIIRGFWTCLCGAVVVLLANDSGVVAAATLMIYPSFLLLALAIQDPATSRF